jgi:transposase
MHAYTVVAKCADSLPFYRLARRFQRDGIPLERSTLDRLFHRSAELLTPIARRILELVVASERVNADETPVFVQAPEKCRRGYMWTFLADKLIAYEFSASRSGETPQRVLAGTKGFLQVDGYTGYNVVCVPEGRARVGCLSHARRKFFKALVSAPVDAHEALEQILSLYEVEYEAAIRNILGTPEHLALRKAVTAERLQKLREWMEERQARYPPQSPMGEAIRYGLKTVESLKPVLNDAKMRLDNNVAEGALRLIALGRKNFLFVGDDDAGRNLAALQTVVSTCIANGVNPEAYIADVLLRLDTKSSRIDELLPGNWRAAHQPNTVAQAS